MAPSTKANYKTYEAQARLVRAMVAAHPETKWNYKEIVACYGSDMTEDALNHRWRPLKVESTIVREARSQNLGLDMKNLPVAGNFPGKLADVDCANISKYFGQSTPDGVQFQFRAIKKDAERIRKVADAGGDVANCVLNIGAGGSTGGSNFNTPVKSTPVKSLPKSGGGSGARVRGSNKRAMPTSFIKRSDSDAEEDDEDDLNESSQDWSGKDADETPSKRAKKEPSPRKPKGTPSRRAAAKANDTIASASLQLDDSSDNEGNGRDEPLPPIFGAAPDVKPRRGDLDNMGFPSPGLDPYHSTAHYHGLDQHDMFGDGEI